MVLQLSPGPGQARTSPSLGVSSMVTQLAEAVRHNPTSTGPAGKANTVNWLQPPVKSTSIDSAPGGLRSCDL